MEDIMRRSVLSLVLLITLNILNSQALPPVDLTAEIFELNSVQLEWNHPEQIPMLRHYLDYNNEGVGIDSNVNYICLARFTYDDLMNYYNDYSISDISIIIHSSDFNYVSIQIYEGGYYSGGYYADPGNLIYDHEITDSVLIDDWTHHDLDFPIPIVNGNEYWIGYDIHTTGDHPLAVDIGPMVPDKGAWIFHNNYWSLVSISGSPEGRNWMISGILTNSEDNSKSILEHETLNYVPPRFKKMSLIENSILSLTKRKASSSISVPFSRGLSGYKIYRDGLEIGEISDPYYRSFVDTGLNLGAHIYFVTAIYIDPIGESDPSNTAEVTINLPIPANLTATIVSPFVILQWEETIPEADEYGVYRNQELIYMANSNLFLNNNVLPGNYCYNVTAVFDGGAESGMSNNAYCVIVKTNDNLIPPFTLLNQNYPNPFNPSTTIEFSIQTDSRIDLSIYNLKGQKIKTLTNNELTKGNHSIVWNGVDESNNPVSSGIYYYKLNVNGKTEAVKKCLLLK